MTRHTILFVIGMLCWLGIEVFHKTVEQVPTGEVIHNNWVQPDEDALGITTLKFRIQQLEENAEIDQLNYRDLSNKYKKLLKKSKAIKKKNTRLHEVIVKKNGKILELQNKVHKLHEKILE
jgi:hypothetical protein